jgi:hypothetical protein
MCLADGFSLGLTEGMPQVRSGGAAFSWFLLATVNFD